MFNKFQEAAKRVYAGGDNAHVNTIEGTREVSDALFEYIMQEISDEEGCESKEQAVQRLLTSVRDIEVVIEAICSQDY